MNIFQVELKENRFEIECVGIEKRSAGEENFTRTNALT